MKKLKYYFNEILFKIYKNKYITFDIENKSESDLQEMLDWLDTCCLGSYVIYDLKYKRYHG